MACALSLDGCWHVDCDRFLARLVSRDGDEDLVKGDVPEPILTKEKGFVDPLLDDLVDYTIAVYDRWLAELRAVKDDVELAAIRRAIRIQEQAFGQLVSHLLPYSATVLKYLPYTCLL